MATELEHADVCVLVRTMAITAVENERRFGDLDAVVGDGDFGYSMARGFEQVLTHMDGFSGPAIGPFLRQVGMQVMTKIGGTSGPLWGTGFLRAAAVVGDVTTISPNMVVAMLRAAGDGIAERGRAGLGDKTLLDALLPATDEFERALQRGEDARVALTCAARAAREAADGTAAMQARRGRASYAGERSIGSPDAGAVAVAEMFAAMDAVCGSPDSEQRPPVTEEHR